MPIPLNPRKSPVQLRKRLIAAIAAASNRPIDSTDTRNIFPLPAWMQSRSLPAQSPPEIAPALAVSITDAAIGLPFVNEDSRADMSGENVTIDDAWQTVLPKRFTKRSRQLDQAAEELPAQAAKRILHLSDVNSPMSFSVMTSSTSPVPSENSDSSDPTYVEPTLPLPQLSTTEQLSLTEPASIAERKIGRAHV